ncbi:hypothetical protein RLPCCGM1_c1249 [Rhizobium leguminosarum bv. phaseoli CCGM1]|uniref:hypothetical protein n=1 Tax=Rhizobium phaseoli TaxID=396 RepID=UPI0004D38809|nr:hypothetical protein [Rhizobium phaseoli]KEC73133.1 hypothetical protein RLPCCGM1_c1249 [Rhizobium leguminosarum bv. phaseoli CCGM1]PWI54105.1 hypothetical protein B5K03_11725 [Rhizobium phaseoli]
MSILAFLLRTIGIGGCAFLALYVYDWGLPGASRVPYLSSIPIIGDLTTGRAHSYSADQVRIATATQRAQCDARLEKTVSTFQYDALAAQLAEERKRRLIADLLTTEASKRAEAAVRAKSAAEAALEARIAADTGADGGRWTEEDLKWDGKH